MSDIDLRRSYLLGLLAPNEQRVISVSPAITPHEMPLVFCVIRGSVIITESAPTSVTIQNTTTRPQGYGLMITARWIEKLMSGPWYARLRAFFERHQTTLPAQNRSDDADS